MRTFFLLALLALQLVLSEAQDKPDAPKPGRVEGDADLDALKVRFEIEKDKPSAQRAETLDAIAAIKSDASGALLIEIFDKDKDTGVRALALKGIADWGGPAGLKKLAAVGADTKAPITFRAIAIDALTHPPSLQGLPVA